MYQRGRPSLDAAPRGLYQHSGSSSDSLTSAGGSDDDLDGASSEDFAPLRAVTAARRGEGRQVAGVNPFARFLRSNAEAVLEGAAAEETTGGRGFVHFELPVCKNWFKVRSAHRPDPDITFWQNKSKQILLGLP